MIKVSLLIFVSLGFYVSYMLFIQLLIADHELVKIKSQYTKSLSYVKPDTLKNKQIINFVYFNFSLKEDQRIYILKANIAHVYGGSNAFGGVKKAIENAGQITVWIKNAEITSMTPKVYQIYADDEKVFENTKKPISNVLLSIMLIATILLSCGIYYCYYNYEKMEEFLRIKLITKTTSMQIKQIKLPSSSTSK